jgi:hypothetical protein
MRWPGDHGNPYTTSRLVSADFTLHSVFTPNSGLTEMSEVRCPVVCVCAQCSPKRRNKRWIWSMSRNFTSTAILAHRSWSPAHIIRRCTTSEVERVLLNGLTTNHYPSNRSYSSIENRIIYEYELEPGPLSVICFSCSIRISLTIDVC